ncbi:hypothetical protein A3727_06260 [Erythrobacter sp. HI0038]|nr:hypothetical protein A3719_10735 [Erythrobacter sp. HI0020]KZY17215.1 hypothetical protein A3727_06260 [Erythrobacter sp. HI0038]
MACCPAHDDRTPSLGVTLGQRATFAKEQDEASLLLDVRLQQMFRRTGTGIAVRLVVFDKTPIASSPAITGDTADLISLHELITALPPRVQTSANIHRLPLGKPVRLVGKTSAQSAPVRPVAPFAATPAATANAIDLAYSVLADPAPVPEQAGIYLPYRPSRIAFEDAPVHPTPLVESVAMGSVAAPQADVCPRYRGVGKAIRTQQMFDIGRRWWVLAHGSPSMMALRLPPQGRRGPTILPATGLHPAANKIVTHSGPLSPTNQMFGSTLGFE